MVVSALIYGWSIHLWISIGMVKFKSLIILKYETVPPSYESKFNMLILKYILPDRVMLLVG